MNERLETFSKERKKPHPLKRVMLYERKSMKRIILVVALVLFGFSANAETLVKRTVLNGKVTLTTPESFGPMSNEQLELKYLSSRRPTEVLSDSTGGVSLAFNHTQNKMTPAQVRVAHASLSKSFHSMYPSATWIRDDLIVQNGQIYMVLELITPAIDTKIHNIIYGTSVGNRFLLIAFNTTIQQSEEWLPVGKRIMESIVTK